MTLRLRTRLTELLGIDVPIVQAGMSWASSSSALAIAVSNAGGLGTIGAGPMYLDDLRATIRAVKAGTSRPFAVNVPLYRKGSAECLDIVIEENVPVLIASQGGPRAYIDRFRAAGRVCLHVVASAEHARKAEAAGVHGLIVVGTEAGGHPPPNEVTTLVLVRRIAKATRLPLVATGGIADGAAMAAMLCLGADGVQLGTRFLMTPEASVHVAYKEAVRAAEIDDTATIGPADAPVRVLKNAFVASYRDAAAHGASPDELTTRFKNSTLKMAALDGDTAQGKVEAGQSAGLIDDVVPAGELVGRLMAEFTATVAGLARLLPQTEGVA
ncbi:MAG: nitronate monooxygenase [Proteobacteria bacterium]|nr:nitronate monooxygenase [Pseudomonadota bacterium]